MQVNLTEEREAIARIIAPSSFANPGSITWKERETGRRGAYAKADAILALVSPALIAKAERVDAMTEALEQIAAHADELVTIAETQARIDWIDAELEAETSRLPYGDESEPPCRNGYEISELIAERAGLIARNTLSPKPEDAAS